MRLCGGFWGFGDLRRSKKRVQAHRVARESVDAALVTINHADRIRAAEAGLPERLHRLDGGTAGGDHVLDEAHRFAGLEAPFEAVAGAVLLGRSPHDQERLPGGKRGGDGQGHRAELGAGEPVGAGLHLGRPPRDPLPQLAEDVGLRLEAVLVQVIGRAPAGAQEKVAL